MTDLPVLDSDLARRYLALVLQGSPALNGVAGRLDPSVFPRPTLILVAEIIRDIYAQHNEIPAWETLRGIVNERVRVKKPAQADLLRSQFAELATLPVNDPSITVERAETQAHNCRVEQYVLQMADALTWAKSRGEAVDVGELAAALLPEPEPPPPEAPRILAPRVDLDRLYALAPFFGDMVTAYRPTTDAPFEFMIAAGLISASAAMGKGYHLRVGTDILYPNLWIALIADSTLPRKTTAQGLAHRNRHETGGDWVLPRTGSHEGFVQALADRNGAGVQIISELGGWLRAMERTYLAGHKECLTELYDSIPKFDQQRTRKKVSGEKEKQPDTDVITWPALSLFGASTRGWLNANLSDADVQSGFLARFLFVPVAARQRPKIAVTRRQPPNPEALARVVNALKQVMPVPGAGPNEGQPGRELTIRADAQVTYEQWVKTYPRPLPEAAPFYERLETTVIKLALICGVLRSARSQISRQDMQAACLLGTFFAEGIAYVLGTELALGRAAQQKQKIVRLVEAAGAEGIRREDLMRRSGMYKKDLDVVLDTLTEERQIVEAKARRGFSGRGRFGTVYRAATTADSPTEESAHGRES